ncbi:hypothetical protein Egran_06795 [Elaphomyces granulatus]|uniref:Autophagy-related protein 3 n=1 Tax=Elaphomyces granulatus TaxID=519963 RepID=A0A232LNP3_9EURO|nr:hypothetical protein Egran_06795 [Elaphomyces granulatus]
MFNDQQKSISKHSIPVRTYNLYITYGNYYQTPRLLLTGYLSPSEPLPPSLMMEDFVGDYKDKTVTLEDFPWFDAGVPMASVHPLPVHLSMLAQALANEDSRAPSEPPHRPKELAHLPRYGPAACTSSIGRAYLLYSLS